MARMVYRAKKTGWVVHSEAQPVFRGVYPRCRWCDTRLDKNPDHDCMRTMDARILNKEEG